VRTFERRGVAQPG